jgi:hypothetical protein
MIRALAAIVAAVPAALLLLPAFALTAILLLIASAARAIGRRLEPAFVPWTELMAFDPVLGWRPRPNLDARYLADRDDVFRISTDGEGWPGLRPLDQSAVVAIGDSFAFGYGVDTGRSFAEVGSRVAIKAIGAPGYSMVQGVRLMQQLGARLNGKLLVWLVYLENDLQDNLAPEMRGYRAPFVRRGAGSSLWEIVDSHVSRSPWRCSTLDKRRLFPHLCVPGPLADRAYAACDYLMGEAQAAAERAGAHLVVVTIPHPMQLTVQGRAALAALSGDAQAFDAGLPDRAMAALGTKHGVPVIAGRQTFTRDDYKKREGIHWNERGHRRMARLLEQIYDTFAGLRGDQPLPRHAGVVSFDPPRQETEAMAR